MIMLKISKTEIFCYDDSMNKHKQIQNFERATVVLGYGLFLVYLLSIVLTTIVPWGQIVASPNVQLLNVTAFSLSLVAGAILPTLISFYIGCAVTPKKKKGEPHFNGVLFGIAAFWLTTFFGISLVNLQTVVHGLQVTASWTGVILNVWNVVATVLIMSIVGITFSRRKKKDLTALNHGPYQFVLFTGIASVPLYIIWNHFALPKLDWGNVTSLYILAPAVLIGVCYVALMNQPVARLTRLTVASVAMSLGYIAFYIFNLLSAYFAESYDSFWSTLVGLAVMTAFILIVRRIR